MKWRDVTVGAVLLVKGEQWEVTARDGDAITMRHARLGERTGSPDPVADVEVVHQGQVEADPWDDEPEPVPAKTAEELEQYERALKASAPKSVDPELQRLREYAVKEGLRRSEVEHLDLTDLRQLIHRRRLEQVAKDNDVPPRMVEDAHIRLTLGASLIGELHTSRPPSAPKVEKMDPQTMRNHLNFFHNSYPEKSLKMERLVEMHEQLAEHERHTHDLEF